MTGRLPQVLSVLVLVLVLGHQISAQSAQTPVRGARLGVTGGVTFAHAYADYFSNGRGFTGGGLLVLPVASSVEIETELLYTANRYKTEFAGEEKHENDIEVPALIRFIAPPGTVDSIRPIVYGGPAIGRVMSCTASQFFPQGGYARNFQCVQDNTSKAYYGIVIGGGLGFSMAGQFLTLGGRYDAAFHRNGTTFSRTNRVWSFLMTVERPLRKQP